LRALLSVADREGISALARDLLALDVEVFATDGTREHLAADGIEVRPVSELTGLPNLVGGQVKTFHPAIYAGILARRDVGAQMDELAEQGIGPIDIVVVNVNPFAPAVGAHLVPIDEAIEMIDVGGAALLGAAARDPAVFPDPDRLDIGRTPNPHLGFGAGIHYCVGANIARAELQEALAFLARRVERVELDGEPAYGTILGIYGLDALPLRLYPA
jgi:hypothetical protein